MTWFSPRILWNATRTALGAGRRYRVGFGVVAAVLYAAYVLLPVWLIPGNSLAFQLRLFRWTDLLLFLALSLGTALLITMQAYLFARTRGASRAAAVGRGGVGVWSAIFGGLLATAACSSCIATLLGFLGAGSTIFVVEHRTVFTTTAFAIVAVALLATARRIQGYCVECERVGVRP